MNRRLPVLCALTVSGATLTSLLLSSSHLSPTQAAPLPSRVGEIGQTTQYLPTPPQQGAPWTAPTGQNATGLSPELLSASEALFRLGVADPRGCEYRTITVQAGNVWNGGGEALETHGWVLPDGKAGAQSAVCWNGLVYPVVAVKDHADLKADIAVALKSYVDRVQDNGPNGGFWIPATPERQFISPKFPSLVKAILLLRLGETDLARMMYDKCWLRPQPSPIKNESTFSDPYLQIATQWLWGAYDRAICAHMRGDDRLAVADTDLLTRMLDPIETEATRRGFRKLNSPDASGNEVPVSYIIFLTDLPALHQDSIRRLGEPPDPPLDLNGLKQLPQPQRIAELIRHLDDVDARQNGQPGFVEVFSHPIVKALIAEGPPAVDALLDAGDQDKRLTRSVSYRRDFFTDRHFITVKELALACFAKITEFTEIQRPVSELRTWWAANRNSSPAERCFLQLAEDIPPTNEPPLPSNAKSVERQQRDQRESERISAYYRRWEGAAERIVTRRYRPNDALTPGRPTEIVLLPPDGEELRNRRTPSVSDLLRKRALQLSETTEGRQGFDYNRGARIALMLFSWDPNGSETLSTLQELTRRCLAFQNTRLKREGEEGYGMGRWIARLTLARIRLGDTEAVSEYAAWLRTISPHFLGSGINDTLLPLWAAMDNPEVVHLTEELFTPADGTTPTAWGNLLVDPKSRDNYSVVHMFDSDLIRIHAFQNLVLRRLADTTEAGVATTTKDSPTGHSITWLDGSSMNRGGERAASTQRQVLRTCDRTALVLQTLNGVPFFDPLDSVENRDTACAAIATYLRRYGPTLGRLNQDPSILFNAGDLSHSDYLGPIFPQRSQPATEEDVRNNRAIFSLSGSGQTIRVVPELSAQIPLEADWNNDPAGQVIQANGKTLHISRGYVWQIEEVFDGKQWQRYYGFVGPHGIARAPSNEVTFLDSRVVVPPPTAPPSRP